MRLHQKRTSISVACSKILQHVEKRKQTNQLLRQIGIKAQKHFNFKFKILKTIQTNILEIIAKFIYFVSVCLKILEYEILKIIILLHIDINCIFYIYLIKNDSIIKLSYNFRLFKISLSKVMNKNFYNKIQN